MTHYQEAKKIFHSSKVGKPNKFDNADDYKKVQQSLNVIKRRYKGDEKKSFTSKKKDLSIWRVN